jgi:hypothetical protein
MITITMKRARKVYRKYARGLGEDATERLSFRQWARATLRGPMSPKLAEICK